MIRIPSLAPFPQFFCLEVFGWHEVVIAVYHRPLCQGFTGGSGTGWGRSSPVG